MKGGYFGRGPDGLIGLEGATGAPGEPRARDWPPSSCFVR